jgi:polyisoprenoid-binding protein YceI
MSTDTVNQRVPAGPWTVDRHHSSVTFAITHNGVATFRSHFSSFEATLTGGEAPQLVGSAEVQSIAIEDPKFKGHMMTPNFFDAEAHPRLKFASDRLDVADDGSVRLSGTLSIKGIEREVEATGRFGEVGANHGGHPRTALSVSAAIDRREFGIEWNADLPDGAQVLEWEVVINVDLELAPQAA